MDRTKEIFQKVFSLPLGSEAMGSVDTDNGTGGSHTQYSSQFCDFHPQCLRLSFASVEAGLSSDVLESRRARELKSLASFKTLASSGKINSFAQLQNWLFTEHSAYASKRHLEKHKEAIDVETLKTY
jgi:hypothetical protein